MGGTESRDARDGEMLYLGLSGQTHEVLMRLTVQARGSLSPGPFVCFVHVSDVSACCMQDAFRRPSATDWFVFSQNSYAEALAPSVTVFGIRK